MGELFKRLYLNAIRNNWLNRIFPSPQGSLKRYPQANRKTLSGEEFNQAIGHWQAIPGNLDEVNQPFSEELKQKVLQLMALYDEADDQQRERIKQICLNKKARYYLLDLMYSLGPMIQSSGDVHYLRYGLHAAKIYYHVDWRDIGPPLKLLKFHALRHGIATYRVFSDEILDTADPNIKFWLRSGRDASKYAMLSELYNHGPESLKNECFSNRGWRVWLIRLQKKCLPWEKI